MKLWGTPLKISKVKVLGTVSHVAVSQIDAGFAAAAALSRALKEKKICQLQSLEFRKWCAIMLEQKWKTSQQAGAELTQYRKFIFEARKYQNSKFVSYSYAHERLEKFPK